MININTCNWFDILHWNVESHKILSFAILSNLTIKMDINKAKLVFIGTRMYYTGLWQEFREILYYPVEKK